MISKFYHKLLLQYELFFSFSFMPILLTVLINSDINLMYSGMYIGGYKFLDYYWTYIDIRFRKIFIISFTAMLIFHLKLSGVILSFIMISNILTKLLITPIKHKNVSTQLMGMLLSPLIIYFKLFGIIFLFIFIFNRIKVQSFDFSKKRRMNNKILAISKDKQIMIIVCFMHNFIYFLFSITMPIRVLEKSNNESYLIGFICCVNWILFFKRKLIYIKFKKLGDYKIISFSFAISGILILLLDVSKNFLISLFLILLQGMFSGLSEQFFQCNTFLIEKEQYLNYWRIGGIIGCITNSMCYSIPYFTSNFSFILSIFVSILILRYGFSNKNLFKIE